MTCYQLLLERANKNGYLYLVDRKKRSLKISAINVFPAEIESCIKQLDFVADCCVVPYKVNGKTYLKAFVTLQATPHQAIWSALLSTIAKQSLCSTRCQQALLF